MSKDSGFISKKKPQMISPRVTPLEGVSTYAPEGIRVRGVENPQGFGSDERRCGLDFFGTLGKGMLAKEDLETLENSPGLTPLGFGVDVRNRILNTGHEHEGLSTPEFTENTEILKNSSGLSPLRPFGRNHKKEVLE